MECVPNLFTLPRNIYVTDIVIIITDNMIGSSN